MLRFSFATPLVVSLLVLVSSTSRAAELPTTVDEMRVVLDVINFELKDDARLKRLNLMVEHSENIANSNANDAGLQMMAGFFNAQYAGSKGGLGALKYAKAARDYLEKSTSLDPTIYGASAHSVLGTLYYQVPGWPVGFGNKKTALMHYKKALEISPNGIDSNFTYAGYLLDKKKYAEAKIHLEKAKAAPPRPQRPTADEKLHDVIDQALLEIEKKLSK